MEGLPINVISFCIAPFLDVAALVALHGVCRTTYRALHENAFLKLLREWKEKYNPNRVWLEAAKLGNLDLYVYVRNAAGLSYTSGRQDEHLSWTNSADIARVVLSSINGSVNMGWDRTRFFGEELQPSSGMEGVALGYGGHLCPERDSLGYKFGLMLAERIPWDDQVFLEGAYEGYFGSISRYRNMSETVLRHIVSLYRTFPLSFQLLESRVYSMVLRSGCFDLWQGMWPGMRLYNVRYFAGQLVKCDNPDMIVHVLKLWSYARGDALLLRPAMVEAGNKAVIRWFDRWVETLPI
jgi:hypothetical protein